MSMYSGSTEGLQYADMVREREEREQLHRDEMDEATKRLAMTNQKEMFNAQQTRQGGLASTPSSAGPDPFADTGPRQWGEPISAPVDTLSADHGNLQKFLQHLGMGNVSEAEKAFGDKHVKGGTTKITPEGAEWQSPEGHVVKVPKSIIEHHAFGTALPRPDVTKTMSDLDAARAEESRARITALKNKPTISAGKLADLAIKHRAEMFRMQTALDKEQGAFTNGPVKALKDAQEQAKGAWTTSAEKQAVADAQKVVDDGRRSLRKKQDAITALAEKDPLKVAATEAPADAEAAEIDAAEGSATAPDQTSSTTTATPSSPTALPTRARTAGKGTMSMGGKTVALDGKTITDVPQPGPLTDQATQTETAMPTKEFYTEPTTGQKYPITTRVNPQTGTVERGYLRPTFRSKQQMPADQAIIDAKPKYGIPIQPNVSEADIQRMNREVIGDRLRQDTSNANRGPEAEAGDAYSAIAKTARQVRTNGIDAAHEKIMVDAQNLLRKAKAMKQTQPIQSLADEQKATAVLEKLKKIYPHLGE